VPQTRVTHCGKHAMCGRGRFAVLAACLLNEYAQPCRRRQRGPPAQRKEQSNKDSQRGDSPELEGEPEHAPKKEELPYPVIENISPAFEVPVLFKVNDESDSRWCVEPMIWGIIPTYLNPPSANDHYRMFNKRIESLERGEIAPYFKTVLQTKRCVAIFDGFYEWKTIAGKKHPYYVSLGSAEPLKMAGIYEDSQVFDPKTYSLRSARTFSIITGEPCAKFTLHNRQPVFLTDEQVTRWLDCPPEEVFSLLSEIGKNYLDPSLPFNRTIQFHPVTPNVTNARYQEPDCSVFKSIGTQLTSFFKSTNHSGGDTTSSPAGKVKLEGLDTASACSASSQRTEVIPAEEDVEKLVKAENGNDLTAAYGAKGRSAAVKPEGKAVKTSQIVKSEPADVPVVGQKRGRADVANSDITAIAAPNSPIKRPPISTAVTTSPKKQRITAASKGPATPSAVKARPITSFFAPSPKK
jgi:putative SOS response-associated peptidase YedK